MLDLDTTTSNATIEAPTAHGLYNGIQTFRQLLPPWINRAKAGPGPWTTPVVTITDHPRYQYRGVLLDIARHYESPSAVEELIDQVAAYKVNVFHLHLSDDAGNPALPADPHGIDCGQFNPPQWDYTEDVGYSALCPDSPDTWLPDQHADHVRLVAGHRVHDQLGDGSTSTGDVTGVNATDIHVNSLYTISGEHTYAHPGTYHGTVTLSAGNATPVTADFTVNWP